MISRQTTLFLLVSTLGIGCADRDPAALEGLGISADGKSIDEGSPEAVGLLDFLNDPGTTLTVLDDHVPLDRRAAGNLMAHRNGGDATFGTSDDDLFGSVAEVDAVRWVGPKSLERMVAYADSLGFVPSGSDTLGTYDRVTFSVNEAEWALLVVNEEDHATLDYEVALNVRAVNSIVAARPIASVEDLSKLYYVGTSALEKILDFAIDHYYEEEEEEEIVCSPVLVSTSDSVAEDYSRLLELTTTVDSAYAEVTTFTLGGCENWTDSEEAIALVHRALWEATYIWSWSEAEYIREAADPTAGGNSYTHLIDESLQVIEERTAEGHWNPTVDAEASQLYDERQDLVDALKADLEASPSDFVEVWMYADLIECSEESTALINETDSTVTIVHQLQNC